MIVHCLLEADVDKHLADVSRRTALLRASENGDIDSICLLLEGPRDSNIPYI